MKITILAILAICLCSLSLSAQNNYAVKGMVTDTASRVKLPNTTICILNAKDSIMYKYTYAIDNGLFAINGLPQGKFLLLVSYPDYVDYVEEFTLDATHPTHDFGNVNMQLKSKLLMEVMIKGEIRAIKIKGDTTEFNPKAYVIQPNDKVEDLLKQLPGMTIDKDGKITANGVKVGKVLVDGEEFFGDDPTLVTKNLRADMVESVQLYDKKSDQAAFTGIDDGEKTRTINIKLKEDKKSGVFGKLEGGIGTNGYYQSQAIFNKFKAKYKLSVYGSVANNGKIGLGEDDEDKLGMTNIGQMDDETFRSYSDEDDGWDGKYYGAGQPWARNAGIHFDSKMNADKASINTNYKLRSMDVTGVTTTTSQQSLTSGIINNHSAQTYDKSSFRQKLDAMYQFRPDTSSNFKIGADATLRNSKTDDNYITSTDNGSNVVLNRSNRTNTNNNDQKLVNVNGLYTHKFKTPGRTFSLNLGTSYDENHSIGYVNSETDFFNPLGALDSIVEVHQLKTTAATHMVINSNATYSEPLSKTFAIIFNYGLGVNNAHADTRSYDKGPTGQYDVFNSTFSNNYNFNQLSNQLGAVFNYKKGKALVNFGTKAFAVDFKQVDEYTGIVYKRSFINWAPQASYQYKFSLQKSFKAEYSGRTTQPSLEQIQPIRVNTDPLFITLGNPDLKASFTNRFNVSYNTYGVVSGQSFNVSGSYAFTTAGIANNTITNTSTGKSTTQFINLDKTSSNYFIWTGFNRKIKPIDINGYFTNIFCVCLI